MESKDIRDAVGSPIPVPSRDPEDWVRPTLADWNGASPAADHAVEVRRISPVLSPMVVFLTRVVSRSYTTGR